MSFDIDVYYPRLPGNALRVPQAFCELTLQTTDVERSARFYAEALGLERLSEEADRIWLQIGVRARLGIWTPGEKEFGDEGGSHVHFALSVERRELHEIEGRLSEHSISAEGPVEHEGGDLSLYVEDPDGNVIELWSFFTDNDDRAEPVAALGDTASDQDLRIAEAA